MHVYDTMDTGPMQTRAPTASDHDDSTSNTQQVQSDEEEPEDVRKLEEINIRRESQPFELKVDVNALKNEILVDGMQVCAIIWKKFKSISLSLI